MTLSLRRTASPLDSGVACALLPADRETDAELAKYRLGEVIEVKVLRDRSLPMHRLFFAILDHVATATKWEHRDRLLNAVKLRLGYYDLCLLPNGKAVAAPRSISFADMDQTEFDSFFRRALNVICADVLGGYNPDDLIAEVSSQAAAAPRSPASAPRADRR